MLTVVAIVFTSDSEKKPKESTEQKSNQPADPNAAANTFMKAVLVANATESYDLMTKRLQKQMVSEVRWERFLIVNFKRDDHEGVTLADTNELSEPGNPKPLRFVYELEITQEINRRVELIVRYTDGSWKIDEFISPAPTN